MPIIRIAAAQTVEYRENVDAALRCISDLARRADAEGAALLCFPEGFLQGYLTDETSARRHALDLGSPDFNRILDRLPKAGPMLVIGMIESDGGRLFNTAVVVAHGHLVGRYRKAHLLDGERAFSAGDGSPIFEVEGLRFGINICYDTNFPEAPRRIAELGASLVVCPSNNMMQRQRAEAFKTLHNLVRGERCRETGLWLLSADVTGERDGSVALGPTAVINPQGQVVAQLPLGKAGLLVFDMPCGD
ncbi:carbon-nitrogen hydrolase family protein [Taklimakanibacter lacteus]|uniref:carbon-nitrogen hydrolase family protein n=1 Tax=Taklimakanibacter lacteus TaxID=2268456 RepID=UPI000E65F677